MTEKTCIASGLNTSFLPGSDMTALAHVLDTYETYDMSHVEITSRRLDVIMGGRIIEERAKAAEDVLAGRKINYVLHADHAINLMNLPDLEMHAGDRRGFCGTLPPLRHDLHGDAFRQCAQGCLGPIPVTSCLKSSARN